MSLSADHPRAFLPKVTRKKIPGQLDALGKIASMILSQIEKEARQINGIELQNTGLRQASRMNFISKNFKDMPTSPPATIGEVMKRIKA